MIESLMFEFEELRDVFCSTMKQAGLVGAQATAGASVGPVRLFVCRDGLTGRIIALYNYGS